MGSLSQTGYDHPMIAKLPKLKRRRHTDRRQRLPDLGERELLVLEVIWRSGEVTAQSVQRQMPDDDISLSTVQSTLERLYRKRLVERSKQGRAYCYNATVNKSQLISGLLRNMAHDVAAGDLAPMISGFLDFVSAEAPELTDNLSKSLDTPSGSDNSTGFDDG
jgi:predicted transcriptional regulator